MSVRDPETGQKATSPVVVDQKSLRQVESAQSSGRSRWVVAIAVLVLLTEQSALGFTLIAPALASISVKYATTNIVWAITAFTLAGAVCTPVIGKLGDRYGKRRVLVISAVIAAVGGATCALASSWEMFIAGRALTGVSVAFLPVAYALIRDVFPEGMREVSISIATNGVGLVTVGGPFLAGFLIDNISFESVFWFVTVISALGAIGTLILVPETPIRDASKLDVPGVIGLVVGAFLLLLGISQISTWDLFDPRTIGLLVSGLVVLLVWWQWEVRQDAPLVDTGIFRNRATAAVLFSYSLVASAFVVAGSYLPQFLQTPRALAADYGFGLSATGVAIYNIPTGVMIITSGIVVGVLGKKYGFGIFMVLGGLVAGVGMVGLSLFMEQTWQVLLFWGIMATGAAIYAAGPNLMMLLAPAAHRGIYAGMLFLISGVLSTFFAQLAGLLLENNVAQIVEGYPVYSGRGVSFLLLFAAALSFVSAVVALWIPRKVRSVDAADTIGDGHTLEPTGRDFRVSEEKRDRGEASEWQA